MRVLSSVPEHRASPRPLAATGLFLAAIIAGGATGTWWPGIADRLGGAVDHLVMLLVAVIFFTLPSGGLLDRRRVPRIAFLAVAMNFLLIPVVAFALTSVLIPDDALRVGILIYCLAPCTDWFLGFTRMAGGDTAAGSALIPVQLVLQLALYPVWLGVFAGHQVVNTVSAAGPALIIWFVMPAVLAVALRGALRLVAPRSTRGRVVDAADGAVPVILAALIVCLFAANVGTILSDPSAFGRVLLVVFLFFVVVYVVGEAIARGFGLSHPEHALLTMTTSARNAPLMLAVTTIALPDHPAIAAAIVIGMMVEFPHLTALTHLLATHRHRGHAHGAVATRPGRCRDRWQRSITGAVSG
ncbi:symporter [Dietzia natronolimnaea]|uniref:Symporter n=1 Tax=Dietzia natronolimnaea TaxID=161920 RepID=A0A2A2WM45_9ACTN|nr:arsenic resistance protein [Dietzia natronolimnaea]PAY22251.1 symporter [Dietzia natronolimnaea]